MGTTKFECGESMPGHTLSVSVCLEEVVPAIAPATPAAPAERPRTENRPTERRRERVAAPIEEKPGTKKKRRLFFASIGSVLALTNLAGLQYYLLPIAERVRHPLHDWFRPSGYIGQSAGILAFLLLVFLYLYPLRRRFRQLAFLGGLPHWLDAHIVAGFVVVAVSAIHSAWRFGGVIGLGFWAMVLVAVSGVVGRYLYVHIPRKRSGLAMDFNETETLRQELTEQIARTAGMDAEAVESSLSSVFDPRRARGTLGTLVALVTSDLARWRALRALRRRWNGDGHLDARTLARTMRLARREITLIQQQKLLEATQRVFRLWHVVHRPFSITAFVAVAIHVSVVIYVGVTWFS